MSWSQWPATGVAPPTVVQGPVINPAPNVANPAAASMMAQSQYSPEQWAQMQQHNWQQWAQWQQQFQQWQQQYGAEYQKSMTAMAQARGPAPQPTVPYYNMATPTQPPLPIETKPPPPPDDSHGNQVQQSHSTQQQMLQQPLQQQQPPLPQTAAANVASLFTATQYTQPPPIIPSSYTTAPPPPQTAPPKDHYQYNQNQQPPPSAPPKNQGGFDNRNLAEDNQKFGRNQNFPPPKNNPNWQNQANRNQAPKNDFGVKRPFNQQYNERGDTKRNRLENQPEGNRWQGQGAQGGNQRAQKWNDPVANQRNRWGEPSQPEQHAQNFEEPNNQRNQRWGEPVIQPGNRPPLQSVNPAPKLNPDEPSEAEKKFDKQFAEWEAQFHKWKDQNANHPDKSQYQEYEKKWVTWRAQLLERREQMRRKRLGLTGDAPKTPQGRVSAGPKSEEPHPTFVEHQRDNAQPSQPVQQYSYNDKAAYPQVGTQAIPPVMAKKNLDTSPDAYPQIGPQGMPPLMGQNNFQISHEASTLSGVEVTENKNSLLPLVEPGEVVLISESSENETNQKLDAGGDLPPEHDVAEISQTDDNSAGFLKTTSGDGIPGLDLVKEGDDKTEDSLEASAVEEQKKKPDLEAISRGINSILGDQNLMNMLSLVSQAQPSQSTISSTQNTTLPVKQDSPKFSPVEYGINTENDEFPNQCNIDDQSRSSFNAPNEPENFNRLNEGENASFDCRSFNMEPPDMRSQEPNRGVDYIKGHKTVDPSNKGFNDFNRNNDAFNLGQDNLFNTPESTGRGPNHFNKGTDNFNRAPDNFSYQSKEFNQEPDNFNNSVDNFNRGGNFNRGSDNFNRGSDNFNRGPDNFGRGFDNFNREPDNFGKGQGSFNREQDSFNRGADKFGVKSNNPSKGPPSLLDMDFSKGPGNFNRGGDFGKGLDSFSKSTDNLNRGSEFDRGWESDNSKRSSDEFNREGLNVGYSNFRGGFNKRGGGNLGRGSSDNLNRGGPDNFNRGGPDKLNRGGPNNFNRGGPDNFNRGGFDNLNRGGSDKFNRGGQNNFNRGGSNNFNRGGPNSNWGSDNFNRGANDFSGGRFDFNRGGEDNFQRGGGDNFASGGSDNFDRSNDNFNRGGSDNFNRGRGGLNRGNSGNFQRDRFDEDPFVEESGDSYQEPENFNRPAHDFDRGPESFNNDAKLGKRVLDTFDPLASKNLGFSGGVGRELNNFPPNKGIEGNQMEQVLGFEPPSRWSKPNVVSSELVVPPKQEEKDEVIWKPANVIDYEHKPIKPAEPDILLVPINMFDYRHKLLSRIPLPQRPKWLSDTIKNFPEFDMPMTRPFEPQQIKRFSKEPVDSSRKFFDSRDRTLIDDRKLFDERDRKSYDDRERKGFDNWDRKPFEDRDRKPFEDRERKYFDHCDRDRKAFDDRDRKAFDERDRKSFDDRDRKPFDERDRKPFDDRDRRAFDDRDRKTFDDRDRKTFDDRDRKTFDDRDRKALDDRDRKSFDDRDRKSFDDRDRKSFDDRDRKSFDDRDRKSFGDRDRKSYDRDRKSFEDRDKKSFDDRDRKSFNEDRKDRKRYDERDRKSFGNHDQKEVEETKTIGSKATDHKSEELQDVGFKKSSNNDQLEESENAFKTKVENLEQKNMLMDANKSGKSNITLIEDLLSAPGRFTRPPRIVIILRGPPGSGKSHLAKLIKDKEVENGGSAPRIICLDDYFMVEQDKEIEEDGKKIKVKEMVYEFEECMEASYRQSLMKSFKKTITDGYFTFIIVDNINDKVKYFGEMWSFAKQNGFQVYICEMGLDVQACTKRNIHGRSEIEIERCVAGWEPTPAHHPVVDASSLLQTDNITEVEMEEVNSPASVEANVEEHITSKWDTFEYSVDNLAKLDGISKPLRPSKTMEDFLQLDEWTEPVQTKPGQKRVRWADLEEHKKQEKMRAIGFVVGHTNWDRMMDPTKGSSALTQTKYIDRYK